MVMSVQNYIFAMVLMTTFIFFFMLLWFFIVFRNDKQPMDFSISKMIKNFLISKKINLKILIPFSILTLSLFFIQIPLLGTTYYSIYSKLMYSFWIISIFSWSFLLAKKITKK